VGGGPVLCWQPFGSLVAAGAAWSLPAVTALAANREDPLVVVDVTPMPPAMHVAALLRHIAASLGDSVPAPYALSATVDQVVLLESQRITATTRISSPDETDDLPALLVHKGREILDEAQDLVISSLGLMWPPGPAAHPAAEWDSDAGAVRLGFYPSGDPTRPPVLEVPSYRLRTALLASRAEGRNPRTPARRTWRTFVILRLRTTWSCAAVPVEGPASRRAGRWPDGSSPP